MRAIGPIGVIGPRRVSHGTGPYIIRSLVRQGATKLVLLGSCTETTLDAVESMRRELNSEINMASSLTDLMARPNLCSVVICSPTHMRLLHTTAALRARLPALVEKPFLGSGYAPSFTHGIVADFRHAGLALNVNYWWRQVIRCCLRDSLICDRADIRHLTVELSAPIGGMQGVRSCIPHACSMLAEFGIVTKRALCTISDLATELLTINCSCRGVGGRQVQVCLRFGERRMMRAHEGFTVNGVRVTRCAPRPNRAERFWTSSGNIVEMDPLGDVVAIFLNSLERIDLKEYETIVEIDRMRAQIEEACPL